MLLLDTQARPIIGHRGSAGAHPENTLRAFDGALAEGADALELDVRLSADGVPVVLHDATVDRTTNGTGPVRRFTVDRLQSLDAGGGERIPTLAEVLERYPSVPLILDIKHGACTGPVGELLRRFGAAGRVLVGAFAHRMLRGFGRAPFVRSASGRDTAAFWLAAKLGFAVNGRFRAFTVPERRHGLRVVDRLFLAAARRVGKPVHVWTVDRPDDARRLRALGVAGIITNYPARMRNL